MSVSAGAVASQVRADARRFWPAWLALGLFVGLAFGAVMAASATARRTDTAYQRLVEDTHAPTAAIQVRCEEDADRCGPSSDAFARTLRATDGVLDASAVAILSGPILDADGDLLQANGDPCDSSVDSVTVLASRDPRFGDEILGLRIVEGRRADPSRLDEAVLAPLVAEKKGISVGDRLSVHVGSAVVCDDPSTWGDGYDVTVVGLGFSAIEVPAKSGAQYVQGLHTTPAFASVVPGAAEPHSFVVTLEDGAPVAQLERAGLPAFNVLLQLDDFAGPIDAGLDADANAMWLFALVASLASLCVLVPATSRQRWAIADGDRQLSAIGWTRQERAARSAAHALTIGLVAAVVSVGVMWLASGHSPVGDASRIEAAGAHDLDQLVLAVGVLLVAAFVTGAIVLPALRSPRRRELVRRSPVAGWAARVGFGPAAVTGVRLGIEPDRRLVPARSSILAVAVGLATVSGVLVYTAGAQHLRDTPAERGAVWDAFVYVGERPDGEALAEEARTWPEVAASGPAYYFTLPLELTGRDGPVRVMAFGGGPEDVEPRVLRGRAPRGDGDLLLSEPLAAELGLGIGETVELSLSSRGAPPDEAAVIGSGPTRRFQVVGTGAIPLGDGAFAIATAMTTDGYASLLPVEVRSDLAGRADFLMIDLRDGASHDALAQHLAGVDVAYEEDSPDAIEAGLDNILSVDRTGTESVPDLLGVLMLLVAAGILTYSLVASIGQARRELAVLRSLGFDRHLVQRTARWSGFSQAAAALCVALPAGVIIGRYAWSQYARSLGVSRASTVPLRELAALAVLVVLFAVAVASFAGRWVRRRRASVSLRAPE